jgi:nitrogen regulatory protein P-II 1
MNGLKASEHRILERTPNTGTIEVSDMKEIKAFIHRTRITDVVHELRAAGFEQLSIIDVMGTLHALNNDEREYSLDIGQEVITETKLEVFCADGKLEQALRIIRQNAATSQPVSGWLYVSDTVAMQIDSSAIS